MTTQVLILNAKLQAYLLDNHDVLSVKVYDVDYKSKGTAADNAEVAPINNKNINDNFFVLLS